MSRRSVAALGIAVAREEPCVAVVPLRSLTQAMDASRDTRNQSCPHNVRKRCPEASELHEHRGNSNRPLTCDVTLTTGSLDVERAEIGRQIRHS